MKNLYLVMFIMLLLGSIFTETKAQVVNYSYDSSGNITSKKVIQPAMNSSFSVVSDSIQSLDRLLTDEQINTNVEHEQSSTSQVNKLFEALVYDENNIWNMKQALVIPDWWRTEEEI